MIGETNASPFCFVPAGETCVIAKMLDSYQQAFNSYKRVLSGSLERVREVSRSPLPTKHTLTEFVIGEPACNESYGSVFYPV